MLTKFLAVFGSAIACSIANIPCRGSLFQIPLGILIRKKLASEAACTATEWGKICTH